MWLRNNNYLKASARFTHEVEGGPDEERVEEGEMRAHETSLIANGAVVSRGATKVRRMIGRRGSSQEGSGNIGVALPFSSTLLSPSLSDR